jgi:hypothetical protein
MREWETPTLLGLLERANLNHWMLSSTEYHMMDKVQKPSNPECHTLTCVPKLLILETLHRVQNAGAD